MNDTNNVQRPLILQPEAPMQTARIVVERWFTTENGNPTLHHYQDGFYEWYETNYQEVPKSEIRALVYKFLSDASRIKDGKCVSFDPNAVKVRNILEALAAVTQLSSSRMPPVWLDDLDDPPARELLACKNCLLHPPTGKQYDHSPLFFNLNCVGYAYDPQAPAPVQWLRFLRDLWGDDQEAIGTLQEFFGLCLTGDTSFQRMLLLTGPTRSGKGTIAHILTLLVGRSNKVAPTLDALTQRFGLAPLIGKSLAIIPDARFSGRAGQIAAERLLSISGEDEQSIERKYQATWTGKLPTRIMICTNVLPRIRDVSGALAARFIVLALTESFAGREDRALATKLEPELPGILNWAIDGYRRLIGRRQFIQPKSGQQSADQLMALTSPIKRFLDDRCVIGKDERGRAYTVRCNDLFNEWEQWCADQGDTRAGDMASFGRDLHAALPQVSKRRPREGGKRPWEYAGVALRRELERYGDD